MKFAVQRHAIILAALLQVLPIVRNIFQNPLSPNAFAFILKWSIGGAVVAGTYDACSGATNGFAGGTNLTLTLNSQFSTNITLTTQTSGDGGALCTITNMTTPYSTNVLLNGQSTTNAMPVGLTFKFFDANTGNSSFTNVYCQIFGSPTQIGTNSFHVDLFYAGASPIDAVFRIAVVSGPSSAPVITNQPVSVTNLVGTSPVFTVTAGPTPLNYQWHFNTNNILSGATNASLTITNAQLTNAGFYSVVITNSNGAVTSSPALLMVWQPPVITNQPVGSTNLAGSTINFSVTAGGFPALNYQWKFNTNTVLAGATASTFTITGVRLSQAGGYSVVIANAAGALTSSPAILSVTPPSSPPLTTPAINIAGGLFQFNFNPVAGLTNVVQNSTNLAIGGWSTLTNIPPPSTTNTITVSDFMNATNKFYRVQINP